MNNFEDESENTLFNNSNGGNVNLGKFDKIIIDNDLENIREF